MRPEKLPEAIKSWSLRVSEVSDEVDVSHPNGGRLHLTKREAYVLAQRILELVVYAEAKL